MQMQWSVLKYFEPISLHQNLNNPAKPKGAEEQRTLMDIVWKVSPCTRKQKMHRLPQRPKISHPSVRVHILPGKQLT